MKLQSTLLVLIAGPLRSATAVNLRIKSADLLEASSAKETAADSLQRNLDVLCGEMRLSV